ncbi:MAG: 5'-methylthioadenosine/adenosylhomocysteine nucleosidase [Ruminococcaceae bacterium]|nr:5'-methylthioadenosine/adenosylhomocysteine nucleosidase [Oscillospiraceae bacterium]
MKIGIIAALDCEMTEFCHDFSAVESGYFGIYEGKCGGHDVYICLAGVGKVNAAANTQRLIDLFGVDYVINSGVAGCTCKHLGVCDIVISDKLTYHDFTPIDVLDKYAPYSSVFKADDKLISLAKEACTKIEDENFFFDTGMVVTGDQFVDDSRVVARLRDDYNAYCTEMEGAAVAHVCVLNKVPFVVIRAMSDNADEQADMSFEEMASIAAKRASFVSTFIILNL